MFTIAGGNHEHMRCLQGADQARLRVDCRRGHVITSYTSTDAKRNTMASKGFGENWMNVKVVITSSTHIGYSFETRIITDGGTSLTISDANPYAT